MKIEKNSAQFKMFNEWYKLIQMFDAPKNEEDIKKIKSEMIDWAINLPIEAQLFGAFLVSAFVRKLEYDLKAGNKPLEVYRKGDGIGIRSVKE